MENRHLFRGKRTDNNEWVIGNRIDSPDGRVAISETGGDWKLYECDPDTICQCTGFTENYKGKEQDKLLWEKDIVRCIHDGKERTYVVQWDESELDFKGTNGKENYGNYFQYLSCCDEIEVIGNAIDNPELLTE